MKKSCCSKADTKQKNMDVAEEVKNAVAELTKAAKMVKDKYEGIDDKTKMKIIAGVAGALALIAGIVGAKSIKKKMKK